MKHGDLDCSVCYRMGLKMEAKWRIWPDCQSPNDYVCTEHASVALYLGMEVWNPDGSGGTVRSPVGQIQIIHYEK